MPAAHSPREKTFLLARPEARALEWIARRLPARVMPDHMTLLGVLAAFGIAGAYVLSNGDRAWLWAASALLVVHWLGDSLDGTLARVRRSERPTYGYYLDHLVDAVATAVIGLGLGLSPYLLLGDRPADRRRLPRAVDQHVPRDPGVRRVLARLRAARPDRGAARPDRAEHRCSRSGVGLEAGVGGLDFTRARRDRRGWPWWRCSAGSACVRPATCGSLAEREPAPPRGYA